MAMNRRAAVVKKLLDNAGYTGDFMRLAESLPPQTIAQFDKLLNRKEPSVGPGMDSGIVVAYKSGEVVKDRPMQGNFSKEGIAVYEDGGAVERLITRDPRVEYPTFLPFGVLTEPDPAGSLLSEQSTVLAMPEFVRGTLEGVKYLDMVRRGQLDPKNATPEQSLAMLGVIPAGGLLFGRAPAGALGMNVFHGTPNKFAPEPGFPQGRPRLDKMGTGEGAQAYGPGFYSADAPKVAKTYQSKVSAMQDGPTATIDGRPIDWNDPVETAAFEFARHNGDRAAAADFHARTFRGGDANPAVQILRSDQKLPEVTLPGNLYKLDIPDADAAKLLDYDAPISQQPQVVRDALDKLGFMPENPDKMAGGDVWYRMRRELGEDEAATAMRESGVPGLRYKDAGSRGTDSGTRNFVVWDQDVLDRTKVLELNEERFAEGGAVEPRSVDSEAEILAIYDLLDEENQKPERERDPERINELYSRLTELQAMSAPPVALEVSDDVYLRPQFDARGGISESNWRVPFGPDNTVKIRDRNMGGIGRLGAEIGFPGFSGNDRISGGVTATYDRTKRLLPDEFIAFGAPSDIRFGPRGVVPRGYDISYSSGEHTFSGNVTPRQEGASRDAPGGRSVLGLGYTYSTPKATYSLQATPFGVRENPDPKTGAAKMVRPFRAGVTIPF
jgi:hypothetical protein